MPATTATVGSLSGHSMSSVDASANNKANKTFLTQHDDHSHYQHNNHSRSEVASSRSSFAVPPVDPTAAASASSSDDTRLHAALHRMREVSDRYAAAKLRYAQRISVVEAGEAAFRAKQAAATEYLKRFHTFIIETDAKRLKAERKEIDERRAKLEKINIITDTNQSLLLAIHKRDLLKLKHERYRYSRMYLESVLISSDEYTEVDELIQRYSMLKQTEIDLTKENNKINHFLENIIIKLNQQNKSTANQLLTLNSTYAQLLKRAELLGNIHTTSANQTTSDEQVKAATKRLAVQCAMAIRNIHARVLATDSARQKKQMRKQQQIQQKAMVNNNNNNVSVQPTQLTQQPQTISLALLPSVDDEAPMNIDPVTASYTSAEQAHQRYIDEISAAPVAMTLADTANQPNATTSSTSTNQAAPNHSSVQHQSSSSGRSASSAHEDEKAREKEMSHLFQCLDAIAERIDDLQKIAKFVQNDLNGEQNPDDDADTDNTTDVTPNPVTDISRNARGRPSIKSNGKTIVSTTASHRNSKSNSGGD